MKRLIVLASMAAVLASVAACNNQPADNPTTGNDSGGQSSSTAQPSSTSASGGSLETLRQHPCAILSSNDLQQLNATSKPTADSVGGAPDCSVPIPNGSVGVGYVPDRGLSQLSVTGPVTDITVGSHQAKQMQETASGGCYIAIGLTSTTRFDVNAITDNESEACSTALKAAQLVEPKLPSAS